MSDNPYPKIGAAVVALGPVILLLAVLWHPYVAVVTDAAAVASAVGAGATRWAASHMLIALALGFAVLAVVVLRMYLHEAGEDRWSLAAIPFVALGGAVLAFAIGAEGLAAAAVARAGGNVEAFLVEAGVWSAPLYLVGALLLGLGWLSLAAAVNRSHVLGRAWSTVVVVALVVLAVTGFVPLGWATVLSGVAATAAFLPLAVRMWLGAAERPLARGAQPSTA